MIKFLNRWYGELLYFLIGEPPAPTKQISLLDKDLELTMASDITGYEEVTSVWYFGKCKVKKNGKWKEISKEEFKDSILDKM